MGIAVSPFHIYLPEKKKIKMNLVVRNEARQRSNKTSLLKVLINGCLEQTKMRFE